MGRINIIKLIIYYAADNTTVWGRNIQNDKTETTYLWALGKQVQLLPQIWSSISTSKKKKFTFSSWGVPLLRKWWQRGGCRRWPQRSSLCDPFVFPAPPHQVCEWLLLKNITMHKDQTKKSVINQADWIKSNDHLLLFSMNQTAESTSILSVFPLIDLTVCGTEVD